MRRLRHRARSNTDASRSLTDTEINYAQIKKELLAIVSGTEKFNQYTYGRGVIVENDHWQATGNHLQEASGFCTQAFAENVASTTKV